MGVNYMAAARSFILFAAVAVGASGVLAQESGGGRFLSPEETRQCLCMEEEIDTLRAGRLPTEELEAEYKRVDELVARARPTVNTDDQAEVDSFRRMFARREALRLRLQAMRGDGYSRLNGAVSRYNALCANNRMFKINVEAVRADPKACAR